MVPEPVRRPVAAPTDPAYRIRLARTPADLRAVQRLRFEVFNLELDEGLAASHDTGLDADAFDAACDHLIGCSSFTSQDERTGAAAWRTLAPALAPPAWRTSPVPAFRCALDRPAPGSVAIPRLLGAYLALGAKVCGPPAIDREFRTIDVLTWIDLATPRLAGLRRPGAFAAAARHPADDSAL
jgi:putative hemolysin